VGMALTYMARSIGITFLNMTGLRSETSLFVVQLFIGSVWIFHGLFSKLLNGIPRHREIIARILGPQYAQMATTIIGIGEIGLGLWTISGWQRFPCAAVQTLALVSMNVIEIALAADLLISVIGMLALNAGLLTLVWTWALSKHGT
jgi:uncharacterized membrane protein YphA (DoxX/SURF4 family)